MIGYQFGMQHINRVVADVWGVPARLSGVEWSRTRAERDRTAAQHRSIGAEVTLWFRGADGIASVVDA